MFVLHFLFRHHHFLFESMFLISEVQGGDHRHHPDGADGQQDGNNIDAVHYLGEVVIRDQGKVLQHRQGHGKRHDADGQKFEDALEEFHQRPGPEHPLHAADKRHLLDVRLDFLGREDQPELDNV